MKLTRESIAELFFGGDNAATRCLFEPTRDDAALHIPGGAAKNPLTTIDWWPYVATMLDNNDIGPFEFDVIQKGTAVHTRAFLNAKSNPSVEAIGKALDQGATLRIVGVSRFEANCAAQLQLLRKVLKREAFVNLYLTPPNTGGLNLHFDLEDSIAVQVKGEKIWKLYASSANKFPRELSVGPPPVSGEPTQIIHMRAGDVLYIPPGVIHTVETRFSSSQHVTFGVHISRKVTMLSGLLDEFAASQEELRRPVRTDETVSREQLTECADAFAHWMARR
jgi:ribosomal protein L16 Arg81 hydroxylase